MKRIANRIDLDALAKGHMIDDLACAAVEAGDLTLARRLFDVARVWRSVAREHAQQI